MAPGAVTHTKLASNAVTGGNVANGSLTLADLAGVDVSGSISYMLGAHSCSYLNLSVSGAKVDQAALLTFTGTANPPAGIVFGPLKVVEAGRIVSTACNETGSDVSATSIHVRIVTFG